MLRDAARLIANALPDRRGQLALLIVLAIVAALAEGGGLLLLAAFIARLQTGAAGPAVPLEAVILGYIVIVAIGAAASSMRTVRTARLRLEATDRLRIEALEALLAANWPTLRDLRAPHVTQAITVDASRVGQGIDYLMSGVSIAIRIPVLFAVTFRLSPALALGTLAVGGVAAFVTSRADRAARRSGDRMVLTGRMLQTRTSEALLGRRVIKAFGLERARIDAFGTALDDARDAQLAQQQVLARSRAVLTASIGAAVAVVLWIGVRVVGLDLGSALVFALACGRLGQSLLTLRGARRIVLAALPAETAVRELIERARAGREPAVVDAIALPRRDIEIRDVSLRYADGTTALRDVSAVIPIGSITAIVGPSGAGKSTLADVIMGLAVPTGGEVRLDGRALDAGGRRAWRRHVGYVPQDAFLFHESIRANLLAAVPDASEADLWAALDAADAGDLVRALPESLDTIAGERGSRLSGGEAQRIALARALLREPALLVLDEPTSALDAASEARIAATLARLKGRHTIVIVAHRQALAAIADHVITLERGGTVPPRRAQAIGR